MSVEALFRAAVVRVEGGPKPGTGFLVAPGRVVTCAHVTGHDASLTVRLDDDSTLAASRQLVCCDRGRPIPDLDEDYPDIAVLAIDLDDHPCVALDHDAPVYGDEFQAYGFPKEGGSVLATPQILAYQGIKGPLATPFIDLSSAKPVTGGMSGGPLLNLRTMAVCAILVATRSLTSTRGGLAVAWTDLGDAFDDLLHANLDFHLHDKSWADAAGRAGPRLIDFDTGHITTAVDVAVKHDDPDYSVRADIILAAGSRLPFTTSSDYTTQNPNESAVPMQILQRAAGLGPSDDVNLFRTLGHLNVGLPPGLRTGTLLQITTAIDEAGRLTAKATYPGANPAQVEPDPPADLSDERIVQVPVRQQNP